MIFSDELKKQVTIRNQSISNDEISLTEASLKLDNAAILLGHVPLSEIDTCHEEDSCDTCDEKYLGPVDWPHQYNSWVLSPNCSTKKTDMNPLLTIIFSADSIFQVYNFYIVQIF